MGSLSPISTATSVLSPFIPGLGAISPILGATSQIVNAFDDTRGDQRSDLRSSQALALKELQQRQAQQDSDLQERTALERERIAAEAQANEAGRRSALRRAMSRQNARFASQGISGQGGSADAVLLGLFEESEDERLERERLDGIRNRALDQEITDRSRLNILQRSQLEERQRLERASSGLF